MIDYFDKVFNPDRERERKEEYERVLQQAYDKKLCCTCKHFVPVGPKTPGIITVYPKCKLGGLALETCSCYVSDIETEV